MSNSNPIDFATASPDEIAKWQGDYEANMHKLFLRDYEGFLTHPARITPEQFEQVCGHCNSREVSEGVINQSFHFELSIYDDGANVAPKFCLWLRELTNYSGVLDPELPENVTKDGSRHYGFLFASRKEALAFIMEMSLVGDDLV